VAGGVYATVGGGQYDTASSEGATVDGGEHNNASGAGSFIGGGGFDGINVAGNTVQANAATIGGGLNNIIPNNGSYAFIGGGYVNTNSGQFATVDGGSANIASGNWATVGGGSLNGASDTDTTVGGGELNKASQQYATVGGGYGNQANNFAAAVPGGYENVASGQYSFAVGNNAQATDNNSFVWGDGSRPGLSQGTNTFTALATGGFWIFSGTYPAGIKLTAGSSSWATISDRNAKKNFQPVNTEAVLAKLAAIPIQQWNYKWEKDGDVPNIGPMAQDYKHAFYPGRDDKSITTLEFDGVELAAIQGLNQKLEETHAENTILKRQNDSLAERLNELEETVKKLAEKK
jgi:trimeric autotransporter adhesin